MSRHIESATGRNADRLQATPAVWFAGSPGAHLAPIVFLIGLSLVIFPTALQAGDNSLRGVGLIVILIGLFAVGRVPDHIVALSFFVTAMVVAGLSPKIALSGFLAQGTWMVFSGMILAAAVKELRLADYLAGRILPSRRPTYIFAVASIGALSLLLAFIVPSTAARVLLMAPLAIAYAERLGYPAGSNASAGLVVAGATTTYFCGGGILTAGLPNIALASLAFERHGLQITYQEYLVCAFPVLSSGAFVLLVVFVRLCFGGWKPVASPAATLLKAPILLTRESRMLAIILAASFGLWATDSYHGISAAWIGMGAAAIVMSGPGRKLTLGDSVKFEVWLLFAALLSLGAVLDATQTTDRLGNWLIGNAPFVADEDWRNLFIVTALGTVLSMVGTNLAAPVLYSTIAEPIAQLTGWPHKAVLMLGIPAWTFVPFLFQAPIILVCAKTFGLPALRVGLFMFLFSLSALATLVPLQFLWMNHLGYFSIPGTSQPNHPTMERGQTDRSSVEAADAPYYHGPAPVVPATMYKTYSGWLYWRCWDEAQHIIVRTESATVDEVGLIRARGIEHYRVDRFYRTIPVTIEIQPASALFSMREVDSARDAEPEQAHDTFVGVISADMRTISSISADCRPELHLTATSENDRTGPMPDGQVISQNDR